MDHSQVIRGGGGVSASVPNKFKILEIIAVSSQIDMGTYVIEVQQFKFEAFEATRQEQNQDKKKDRKIFQVICPLGN